MILGIPFEQLALLVLGMLAAGAVTGVLAGVFGVGGGAVIVPVLYELFGLLGVPLEIRMPLCVGTSLAVIIPTSIRSFRTHRGKGAVDEAVLKAWILPVVVGVALGSLIARDAPAALFKLVFVLVAGVSAIRLLSGRRIVLGETLPGRVGMSLWGGGIGLLSSLMGIGGGQLGNLFMMGYGRGIHSAVATSTGLGVLISIPGALGFVLAGWSRAADYPEVAALQFPLALGYVSLLGFALLIPTSMWAAPIGARIAHGLSQRTLEVAFGIFLLLASARFLFNLLFG